VPYAATLVLQFRDSESLPIDEILAELERLLGRCDDDPSAPQCLDTRWRGGGTAEVYLKSVDAALTYARVKRLFEFEYGSHALVVAWRFHADEKYRPIWPEDYSGSLDFDLSEEEAEEVLEPVDELQDEDEPE
jgi:hypothetical protein